MLQFSIVTVSQTVNYLEQHKTLKHIAVWSQEIQQIQLDLSSECERILAGQHQISTQAQACILFGGGYTEILRPLQKHCNGSYFPSIKYGVKIPVKKTEGNKLLHEVVQERTGQVFLLSISPSPYLNKSRAFWQHLSWLLDTVE